MQSLANLAYAFAAGLTVCGLSATLVEIACGRPPGFRPPLVARDRFGLSLAVTIAAGPFMLANEALAARRAGAIDRAALALCGLAAAIWSTALGIVFVELALLASALLG